MDFSHAVYVSEQTGSPRLTMMCFNMNKITVNGPYLVQGGIPLAHQHIVTDAQGGSLDWREGEAVALPVSPTYALCRCGASGNKPFCDGTHVSAGFHDRD